MVSSGVAMNTSKSFLLKTGEQFLLQWNQGLISALSQYPVKDKNGENMYFHMKDVEVFYRLDENTK